METTPPEAAGFRRWVPILALAIGLFVALQPLFTSGFAAVPGGPRDARLVHFSLEHAHRFLLRQEPHLDLWDPPLFYPARNVAAYTDLMLSLTPLYTPWRLLGASPDTAFQLWLIGVWGLNFLAFHLLLTRVLRLDPAAAAGGAYLFAFGAPRVGNTTHPQLVPGFYLVLALYALFRLLETDSDILARRRWIFVFPLALVLQLYGAFYPAFFFALFCAAAAGFALLWRDSRQRLFQLARRDGWVLAAAGALAAILAAPLAERYLLAAETLGLRTWAHVEPLLPRWQSWLLMGRDNRLFGWIHDSELLPAGELWRSSALSCGLGVVATVGALAGLWSARGRASTRLFLALWLLAVLLTTLWPGGWTWWRLVFDNLPGAGGIRAVGRVGILLLIPAGIGLAHFFESRLKRRQSLLVLALGGIMAVEHAARIRHYDPRAAQRRVAAISSQLGPHCESFFVHTAGHVANSPIHEDAMWAALETGVPTINGRYGNDPPGWRLRTADRMPSGPARRATIEAALEEWIQGYRLDPATICRLQLN